MKSKVSLTATIRAQVEARFMNHTATKYDEVMLALFEETREQRATICALNLKLSMCEMLSEPPKLSEELSAIMYGSNKEKEQPVVQD